MTREELAEYAGKLGFRWIAMHEDGQWVMCNHWGHRDEEAFTERGERKHEGDLGGFWWSYGQIIRVPDYIRVEWEGDWRKSFLKCKYMEVTEDAEPVTVESFYEELFNPTGEGGYSKVSQWKYLVDGDERVRVNMAMNTIEEYRNALLDAGKLKETNND